MNQPSPPPQAICGFHQDEHQDWVAELDCGHNQHVRHNPPWIVRLWVVTAAGRKAALGQTLPCRKCLDGAAKDNLIVNGADVMPTTSET